MAPVTTRGLGVGVEPTTETSAPALMSGPQAPVEPGSPEQGEPATPEEQEAYNSIVAAAMLALYNDKILKRFTGTVRGSQDPVEEIAEMASSILLRVMAQARDEEADVPGVVILNAMMEIVEEVGEVVDRVGNDLSQDQLQTSYLMAMDRFRSQAQAQGIYTDADIAEDQAAVQGMAQEGKLEGIMAQLSQLQGGGSV